MSSMFTVRLAMPEDAASFVELQKKLAVENNYMLQTTAEAHAMTVEKQSSAFTNMAHEQSLAKVLVATHDDVVIGFLGFMKNNFARMQHVVSRLAVGVDSNFHRRGVATLLFQEAERLWLQDDIHRIEFTTIIDNLPAISLYLKLGYLVEGIRYQSVNIDGRLINEYYLAKYMN